MREKATRTVQWSFVFGLALLPKTAVADITAVWANSGDEKITRDELRATTGSTSTLSGAWDGTAVKIFGARNEVVSFDMILEAGSGASDVSVSFDSLVGADGAAIRSAPATGDGVFDWTRRDIELFYVRYLQILGLSRTANNPSYDERLIPSGMRRPFRLNWRGCALGSGDWTNRPGHDKFYPEIAVPLELVPAFNIAPGRNQAVWVDVYIPPKTPAGLYRGTLEIRVRGTAVREIPVRLTVRNFTLPDSPSAKTMLFYSSSDIDKRFFGDARPRPGTPPAAAASRIRDRYFMLAHRHRISLIGDDPAGDCGEPGDKPCDDWLPRLNGALFTAAHGYAGPGVGTGNGVYSIGTYGSWNWRGGTREQMWAHADKWTDWFEKNSPSTEYFLYLIDESSDFAQIEKWSRWIVDNPGSGRRMRSMATLPLPKAATEVPSLDIPTSALDVGDPAKWRPAADIYADPANARRRLFMYNGSRPGSGSFVTEDDGTALRETAWGQFKKKIDRWFYWNATYYGDFQNGAGETDVFTRAQTFGGASHFDASSSGSGQGTGYGLTSDHYGNGDGVLLYPGTDKIFPSSSYGVEGPIASLRLKAWRRGIQDADYLALARARDSEATAKIVDRMVPKVLWEYGVRNSADPTYQCTDVSWPTAADAWEDARAGLAAIIERGNPL